MARHLDPVEAHSAKAEGTASPHAAAGVSLGFERRLWRALDHLRGRMEVPDQRRLILGLLFLAGLDPDQSPLEIPPDARWPALVQLADDDLATGLDVALAALAGVNPTLDGALPSTLGAARLAPPRLRQLVDFFEGERARLHADRDVLGRAYEYLLERFAGGSGRGEFYTPPSVVRLLVALLGDAPKSIYDPCCGSGGMFVEALRHRGSADAVWICGQESNPETRAIARMNLALRGIVADLGPSAADTLAHDQHPDARVDAVLANPPFNLGSWRGEATREDPRWARGFAPDSNANYAWLQHIVAHLLPSGTGAVVLANGALTTRRAEEAQIRARMLDDGLVEAVVTLPDLLFYATPIPACVWVLRGPGHGTDQRVLLVDGRALGALKTRSQRVLQPDDIRRVHDVLRAFRGGGAPVEPGFCTVVSRAQLAARDDLLTPGLHIPIATPSQGPAGGLDADIAAYQAAAERSRLAASAVADAIAALRP